MSETVQAAPAADDRLSSDDGGRRQAADDDDDADAARRKLENNDDDYDDDDDMAVLQASTFASDTSNASVHVSAAALTEAFDVRGGGFLSGRTSRAGSTQSFSSAAVEEFSDRLLMRETAAQALGLTVLPSAVVTEKHHVWINPQTQRGSSIHAADDFDDDDDGDDDDDDEQQLMRKSVAMAIGVSLPPGVAEYGTRSSRHSSVPASPYPESAAAAAAAVIERLTSNMVKSINELRETAKIVAEIKQTAIFADRESGFGRRCEVGTGGGTVGSCIDLGFNIFKRLPYVLNCVASYS